MKDEDRYLHLARLICGIDRVERSSGPLRPLSAHVRAYCQRVIYAAYYGPARHEAGEGGER